MDRIAAQQIGRERRPAHEIGTALNDVLLAGLAVKPEIESIGRADSASNEAWRIACGQNK